MGRLQHGGIAFVCGTALLCAPLSPSLPLGGRQAVCGPRAPAGPGNSPAVLTGEQRGKYSSKQTLHQTGGKHGHRYRSQQDQESWLLHVLLRALCLVRVIDIRI